MNHFAVDQWADFVRAVADPCQRESMARHLGSCSACATQVRWLRGVAAHAALDVHYEPPAWLLRHARARFTLAHPMGRPSQIPARLVFDTLAAPAAAGIRGAAGVNRHTLFEADEYTVDLKVEHAQSTASTTLVGQVVSRDGSRSVPTVPVFLTAGRVLVASTVSGEFGEFLLQYEPHPNLRLQIDVEDGARQIDIDLADDAGDRARIARPPARQRRRSARSHAAE